MLDSMSFLVTYLIYSNDCISSEPPDLSSITSQHFYFGDHKFIFDTCESVSGFLNKFTSIIFKNYLHI